MSVFVVLLPYNHEINEDYFLYFRTIVVYIESIKQFRGDAIPEDRNGQQKEGCRTYMPQRK